MAHVLLFHHAEGLTDGVVAFADELRAAGHQVDTPDVYDGRTFTSLDDGLAYARGVGFQEVFDRGVRAADGLPSEIVYAGFSLGGMPAQALAQSRPGARGALLFHSAAPSAELGGSWPSGVDLQIHGMDEDPFFEGEDLLAARALVEEAGRVGEAELFLYPGDQHLFADSSLPAYDEAAAGLLLERVLAFLAVR
jgi:dienelactone hydrolase